MSHRSQCAANQAKLRGMKIVHQGSFNSLFFNMPNFNNLPDDLIQQILGNIPECQPHESNTPWKYALDFLSICHRWRNIAARQIYKYAFFRIFYFNQPNSRSMTVFTNIGLASQNGFLDTVRRISVTIDVTYDAGQTLLSMLVDLISPRALSEKIGHFGDEEAISHIARSLPNINRVYFESKNPFEATNSIFEQLISCYTGQLLDVSYSSLTCSLKRMLTATPIDFTIRLNPSSTDWESIIHPDSLKSAKLKIILAPMRWNIFYENGGPNSIVFNNLETLRIGKYDHMGFLYTAMPENTHVSVDKPHLTVGFPKLRKLYLKDIQLPTSSYKMLLQSPIETLQIAGSLEQVMPLCDNNISRLKAIILDIANYAPALPETAVSDLNKLFQHARGVDRVHCTMYGIITKINLENVKWPNITSLTIRDIIDFKKIFNALPSMPKLAHLTLIPTNYSDNHTIFVEAADAFKKLENSDLDPATVRIKCLTFAIFPYSQYDVVDEAFEGLRRFLPGLKTIIKDLQRL